LITWNKKVPQALVSRLYEQTASGIFDDELLDEVGCALYARCKSVVSATCGFEKKVLICPNPMCEAEIKLVGGYFSCRCGFNASWDEFKKSYKGRQLHAANALPIFEKFIADFPKAKTYGDKITCVDVLIHSFHIKMSYYRTLDDYDVDNEGVELNRPAGAN